LDYSDRLEQAIAEALKPFGVGVATGEVAQNKVIFKQLLQEDAIEFCQIDSCRIAGPVS
jgi:L-alanine-DL-glutamate epimerase-like enolase superfamily enzyme